MADCCDDCVDEPCCDKIITEGVTTDIDDLAQYICCQRNFYIIYKFMEQLNKDELKELRRQLRTYVPNGVLHNELEGVFNESIRKAS
jgi:hypothetical protein